MKLSTADVQRLINSPNQTAAREAAIGELQRAATANGVRIEGDVFQLAASSDAAFGALVALVAPDATPKVAGVLAFRAAKPDPNVGRFFREMDTAWTVSDSVEGKYLVTPEKGSHHTAWLATPEQLDVYLSDHRFIRDSDGIVWRIEGERGGLTDVSSAGGKYAAFPTAKLGLFEAA